MTMTMTKRTTTDDFSKDMEKQFVPVEIAIKLKELGFDEPCFGFFDIKGLHSYNHEKNTKNINSKWEQDIRNIIISAPIYQQVIDWFRINYDIDIYPMNVKDGYTFIINQNGGDCIYWRNKKPMSYDRARLFCIEKLIKIVK